ncbi:UDP pyrophosphate synthase [Bacillus sp. FJAT-21945]|nr:UDP pyrophosphate synthase [Bacillus sp. FJAT-21945]
MLRRLYMQNIPTHIAIMMDGNGRWGKNRGLTRSQGHFAGSKAMENIIDASLEIGIRILTLYAFSTENWTRPKEEVNYLMDLPARYLNEKLPEFMRKGIKVIISGEIDGLPIHTREAVKAAVSKTSNNSKLTINFALNYGGRNEILFAVKSIVKDFNNAKITPEDISENILENYLYTSGLADPDIIIRTGGEKRISNFLLWQASKSEIWFTDTFFPDFNKQMLIQAINEVNQRKLLNRN